METKEIKDVPTLTLENNKLIMEFMELKPTKTNGKYSYRDGVFFSCTEDTEQAVINSMAKYVKYNTSWDWLMPVCERFFELAPVDLDGFDDINNALHDSLWGLNINPFYKAIIIAIKWYNLNK